MRADFLLDTFRNAGAKDAVAWKGRCYTFTDIVGRIEEFNSYLAKNRVEPGTVVMLEGDYSPNMIALVIALVNRACIVVPIARAAEQKDEFIGICQAEVIFTVDEEDRVSLTRFDRVAQHALYDVLRQRDNPGLVVFSSGSTGKSKAIVHDFSRFLEKFKVPRKAFRSIAFLRFDHLGGINTIFHTLSNSGCVIVIQNRTPDEVLGLITKFRADLLPCSPTFLNLILLSEAQKRFDLSSLKMITYGTETMPESLLQKLNAAFPKIDFLQTYGLTESGVVRSRSKSSDSLWVKVGGEGVALRVVDGLLEMKSDWLMLGYLNAPNPFTEDGWLITGDQVELDGDYIKILGRKSDIINVGGEKVFPAEVESVIRELGEVDDVTVFGEAHAITGNIVCARVRLAAGHDSSATTKKIKKLCRERLQPYKVPIKVSYSDVVEYSDRFKKVRLKLKAS